VQAQAAAEAGLDYAASILSTGLCQAQYTSTTEPIFTVDIASSTLDTSPGTVDTSWVAGCPTTVNVKRLKLTATGTAVAHGVAGNSSGDSRKVEAIYPYVPSPPLYGPDPSGAAIYSYSQSDPTVNNLTLTQAGTVKPTIQFLSGGLECTSGSTIHGDVILGDGALTATSGCKIDGDLWTSKTVEVGSGTVTGNVFAAGTAVPSVTLSNSAIVDGDVRAAGPVDIKGVVGGNVIAGPGIGLSKFSNTSSVGGLFTGAGTVSDPGGILHTPVITNQSGIIAPVVPYVPGWVDYDYDIDDWRNADGTMYNVQTMADCSVVPLTAALALAQLSSSPSVIDARACAIPPDFRTMNLTLKSDLVIVAKAFTLGNNNFKSSNSTERHLWFIIPDTVPNVAPAAPVPDCPAGGFAKIVNNVTVEDTVAALIYSPCEIANAGNMWRGQMYASSVKTSAPFTLKYVPIGIPTVNFTTGQQTPVVPPGTGVLGDRTSIRNLVV
jgi:Protein of unknown function, DUF583.